jgi:hypothetical protein
VLAERFGYPVIHVSIEGKIVLEGSPESMLVSNGEFGATGGGAEIDFGRIFPNSPDFDEVLRNIATIQMGGRAAEEMTHPASAQSAHAKSDEFKFRDAWKKYRTREQLDFLLAEGHRRARAFLAHPTISKEHQRVRDFLFSGRDCTYPNGESVRKAIRGTNE